MSLDLKTVCFQPVKTRVVLCIRSVRTWRWRDEAPPGGGARIQPLDVDLRLRGENETDVRSDVEDSSLGQKTQVCVFRTFVLDSYTCRVKRAEMCEC